MRPKILTVDDSKAVRIIVKKALKSYDCEVLEASNGEEGLSVAAKEKPDLILLDVTMPTMDGVEMLTRLKSDAALKGINVMMLTAESGREMVVKIAKLGVRDYIVKPFKEEALIEKIIRIIDLKVLAAAGGTQKKTLADPASIVVIDDKEAIIAQVTEALAQRPNWTVKGMADTEEAFEYAKNNAVDCFLVSLSLPNEAAFSFYRLLRSTVKTNSTPVIGMALKTATAENEQAVNMGFSGVIGKPIVAQDAYQRVLRALNIDLMGSCFKTQGSTLLIELNDNNFAADLGLGSALKKHIATAAEAGVNKVCFNLSGVTEFTVEVVKVLDPAVQQCQELSMAQEFIAAPGVVSQAKSFEDSKAWAFAAV